jgi:hypothetical protein
MFLRTQRSVLRAKRNLYVKVLVLLGLLSFTFLTGCGGQNKEKEQQRINDSLAGEKQKQDIIMARKQDSIATAAIEKARQDSIAMADSVAKAKLHKLVNYAPVHTVTKYGIQVNDFKPKE